MAHSHLNKRKAFAFIAEELAAGRQPTDAQIMDLCSLVTVEQARTLLADLADEGAIALSFADGVRMVALGPKERTKAGPSPVPIPSVVKPARRALAAIDEDAAASRLMSIMRRAPVEAEPAPKVQPEPKSEPICQPTPPAPSPAETEFERHRAAFVAKPSLNPDTSRQINIRVPGPVYAALVARGEAEGCAAGGIARRIFLDAFDASLCDTGHKHRISAAVQRAWAADPSGLDLAGFVTGLIEVGLREMQRFEHIEAAE